MVPLPRFCAIVLPAAFVWSVSWFGMYSFVNSYVSRDLRVSTQDWTTATLWLTASMIFCQLWAADLAGWIGRVPALLVAMIATAVSFAGIAIARDFRIVGPMLALMGFAQAVANVIWFPLVAQLGGDKPGRALAINQLLTVVVSFAILVAGSTLAARLTYLTLFWIITGVSLGCAGVFALVTRRPSPGTTPQPGEWTMPRDEPIVSLRHLKRSDIAALMGGPFLFILLIGVALEPFNYHTLNQLFQNLLRSTITGSATGGAIATTQASIGAAKNESAGVEQFITNLVAIGRMPAIIMLFVLGRRIDRLNPVRWYGMGLTFAAITLVTMGVITSKGSLMVLYPLFYVFHGAVWAGNSASVNAVVEPRLREVAFILMSTFANVALLIVGLIHNSLAEQGVSLRTIFVLCGSVALFSGVMLTLYAKRALRLTWEARNRSQNSKARMQQSAESER